MQQPPIVHFSPPSAPSASDRSPSGQSPSDQTECSAPLFASSLSSPSLLPAALSVQRSVRLVRLLCVRGRVVPPRAVARIGRIGGASRSRLRVQRAQQSSSSLPIAPFASFSPVPSSQPAPAPVSASVSAPLASLPAAFATTRSDDRDRTSRGKRRKEAPIGGGGLFRGVRVPPVFPPSLSSSSPSSSPSPSLSSPSGPSPLPAPFSPSAPSAAPSSAFSVLRRPLRGQLRRDRRSKPFHS